VWLNGVDALSAALAIFALTGSAAAKRPPPWQLEFSTVEPDLVLALSIQNLLGTIKGWLRCAHQWTALYGDKRISKTIKCDYFMPSKSIFLSLGRTRQLEIEAD